MEIVGARIRNRFSVSVFVFVFVFVSVSAKAAPQKMKGLAIRAPLSGGWGERGRIKGILPRSARPPRGRQRRGSRIQSVGKEKSGREGTEAVITLVFKTILEFAGCRQNERKEYENRPIPTSRRHSEKSPRKRPTTDSLFPFIFSFFLPFLGLESQEWEINNTGTGNGKRFEQI